MVKRLPQPRDNNASTKTPSAKQKLRDTKRLVWEMDNQQG
jgi:hypothetical protein